MESEFTTDVANCYLISCQNNNALTCSLVRVNIGTDGICLQYEPIEENDAQDK
jgi:hypothetical protein